MMSVNEQVVGTDEVSTLPMVRSTRHEASKRGSSIAAARSQANAQYRKETGVKLRAHPTSGEPEYTADQLAFMAAVAEFKNRTGRKFPTLCEILEVAISLGYSRWEGDWPKDRAPAAAVVAA